MGWLSTLLSGGDTVKAVGDSLDNLFTSDDERLERANEQRKAQLAHDLELVKIEAQALANQVEVNKIEAGNSSLFVSGWRPAVGWICGFALAYVSIIEPIARFIATMVGYTGTFPVLDTEITMQVLFGLLGLGTLRTIEKSKRVAR